MLAKNQFLFIAEANKQQINASDSNDLRVIFCGWFHRMTTLLNIINFDHVFDLNAQIFFIENSANSAMQRMLGENIRLKSYRSHGMILFG